MIEVEKQKIAATINQRLESMIRDIVVNKVKERVKIQVCFGVGTRRAYSFTPFPKIAGLVEPYNKVIQGSKGRNMRNKLFLTNM